MELKGDFWREEMFGEASVTMGRQTRQRDIIRRPKIMSRPNSARTSNFCSGRDSRGRFEP